MSENKGKKRNWLAIVLAGLSIFGLIFGTVTTIKLSEAEQARISAQNQLAEQSEIVEEISDRVFSRLATQYDDSIDRLEQSNADLAKLIRDRDERILALTKTVATIRPTRIVVRRENVAETPVTEGDILRSRVDFDQTDDPVRVHGFTLTNPAEAELEVEFTRPINLTTVTTQEQDGSWRTYVESDWENLEIGNIETVVTPLPDLQTRPRERIILGLDAGFSPRSLDSFTGNARIMYEFSNKIAVGPQFGLNYINGTSRMNVGLGVQWRPGRRR